ncbi:pentapeptide repeat-containing protein [Mucilaginibacter sabulilitoris]|uniref:Pentapeptide repeat-containing protein n=1 Tax=Mucilaginibacter sabulilitoris TaxID=1173583 RepID=A0ABZ0TF89_9SPHI|nr:pentapeptide repeat-containing protein [Mucilaginibacter sabulilitoris]WPU91841.1 pentapeptide repeat-containing protein [Mucilaginibacter sabulilitoris]
MKIKLEIKNWWTGKVLFEFETEGNTIAKTVAECIRQAREKESLANLSGANLSGANLSLANLSGADLSGANLSGANLSGADLRSADLSGANLSGANLRSANLRSANLSIANLSIANLSGANLSIADLSGANLSGANLSGADLSGADLSGANLSIANLSGANLSGANLSIANLSGANLSGANLSIANLSGANLSGAVNNPIKADFFMILLYARNEVQGLRQALIDGKVDGSTYTGECACLVGTLANVRNCSYEQIPGIKPDADRPAERWFTGIRSGDTPDNNEVSKLTLEWVDEFLILTAA